MNTLKIKKLGEGAILPKQATDNSAGYDLYSSGDNEYILPGSVKLIHTNIAMEIPEGYVGLIYPRSSLGIRENLRLANGTGVIDSDYRGEIIVALHNFGEDVRVIYPGQRIAQIVFVKYESFLIEEADELSTTDRGTSGFGSTGKF